MSWAETYQMQQYQGLRKKKIKKRESHCSGLLDVAYSHQAACLKSGSDKTHSWDAGGATEVLPELSA